MKRFAIIVTAAALLLSTCMTEVYATTSESGTSAQKKVVFYLKPDISVELDGVREAFKNAKGQAVYPVIYNGTAYLPVRAVSALMKEPVQWDSGSKTVYIGKTLAYPVKSEAPLTTDAAIAAGDSDLAAAAALQPSLVTGYLKSDVLVMYDFEIQSFKDANGLTVYPLNYNGTTYLPIRSISGLMNEPIVWDGAAKKISIGDGKTDTDGNAATKDGSDKDVDNDNSAVMTELQEVYDSEEALYYEASAKVSTIKSATAEEKQAIATSSSDNYLKAQTTTSDLKSMDTSSFTTSEKDAYDKLVDFAESNEYYILVLENIAYLAASDSDYSMLADTFLYFAMDAQTKMEAAKKSVYAEPVYN